MRKFVMILVNRIFKKEKSAKINDDTIYKAVKEWSKNPDKAEIKYGHISKWDTSKVTSMRKLFYKNTYFNAPINEWDVSKVQNMEEMFAKASSFNQDISNWDVSSVTNMKAMFLEAFKFNQAIGKWNVTNVNNMMFMFYEAHNFQQKLINWDVNNVVFYSHFSKKKSQLNFLHPNFSNPNL